MLRFLSKVAFLSNIAFAIVFAMHWINGIDKWDQVLVSNLIITAYFIATATTLLVNICTLVLLVQKKANPIPLWLRVANVFFFILQFIYFQFT